MSAVTLQPPPSRTRASSTSLQCLQVHTLGRRRSTSCLNSSSDDQLPQPQTPEPDHSEPEQLPESSSMLLVFASRFLQWLHLPAHPQAWSSAQSSPRSSVDLYILPLSATQESFNIPPIPEKEPQSWFQGLPSITPSILLVLVSLPLSTAVVLYCLTTLPISMSWPHTLSDLAQLGRELHGYTQSGTWPLLHVMGVMAISAIWKHAWSIPGSVLWNVLAGALFSPAFATILLTTLTTIGSVCASLLSTPLAPFLTYMFPRALDMTRSALNGDSDSDIDPSTTKSSTKSSAWESISPAGCAAVSLSDCALGTFIGCLPWTAVTCQIGDILQTVAKTPSPSSQTISSLIASPEIIVKLVFLSFLSLAPILGRDYLRAMIAPAASEARPLTSQTDPRHPRWKWVQEWRAKIRLNSSSTERRRMATELAILVDEKRQLEEFSS
ncbi:hypothetical protein BKA70DRAFT_1511914 [Coprinopsis sp. MPI-PUGE-AT-0042]|nr:hypothetical protein BKA70DRAFT_1511914 [Coprinopsis sp. MPI-PUGE-AT-0042]